MGNLAGFKYREIVRKCTSPETALVKEFATLQDIASHMGYKTSKDALFDKYPPYETVNGRLTKEKDKNTLDQVDFLKGSSKAEDISNAGKFYNVVKSLK